MITTLLGGPLDGQKLSLAGFTRPTYSWKDALTEQGATVFEGGPPLLVCNDDGNFVAVWPDGHRIWPADVPPTRSGGFRHHYRAAEGYGYRFERTADTPVAAIA